MEIILASPRGFCAGVERAIEIVEKALIKYGAPVYVRHEIVHNKFVVDDLKAKGAVFVSEIDQIPDGAITIFSAHGVSNQVEKSAKDRNLPIIDATCPLVTKVHLAAKKNEAQGRNIILIGHVGHPEVEGTAGRVKQNVMIISSERDVDDIEIKDENNLSYVTQTTLSIDDTAKIIKKLKQKFPLISGPELKDICYATQNRQNAVKDLSKQVDVILVIGAVNSSNSNRLKDLAEEMGVRSYLIDGPESIDLQWFKACDKVGITAGASAPEVLVESVIAYLVKHFDATVKIGKTIDENVRFRLPQELR